MTGTIRKTGDDALSKLPKNALWYLIITCKKCSGVVHSSLGVAWRGMLFSGVKMEDLCVKNGVVRVIRTSGTNRVE